MTAEAAFAVRSWRVGRHTVEMTIQRPVPGAVVHAAVEWSPSEPSRLTSAEWAEYRAGRAHAVAQLAVELGITMAVIEL